MDNKILWKQVLGVALVGVSGGLVWQWFQGSMLVAGIVGIAIMLPGIYLIYSQNSYENRLVTTNQIHDLVVVLFICHLG